MWAKTEEIWLGQIQATPYKLITEEKQGCVLTPTFFTLFLTVVLTILHRETQEEVFIRTRTDGQLFNLARLRARTKTRQELIRELLFADDTTLVAHTQAHTK